MKAIRLHARGGPEQLVYEDAPRPVPGPGDALVRVYATGITRTELTWDETYQNPDGSPRIPTIPGHELSGVIESVPIGVRDLGPGDAVYALIDFPRDGAAAEYVAVQANDLALKPRTLDHAHSAAVTLSGLTAWQALVHARRSAAGAEGFDPRRRRRRGHVRGAVGALERRARHHNQLRSEPGISAQPGRRSDHRLHARRVSKTNCATSTWCWMLSAAIPWSVRGECCAPAAQ